MSSCLTTVEILNCAGGDASAKGLEHLDACESCAAAVAAALRNGEPGPNGSGDPWDDLSNVDLDGRYVVERKLGEGGMGVVLLAFDRSLERNVALKIVRTLDDDSELRLHRESRLMAGLRHPNVVTVFDIGEFGGGAYVSMEYVEGSTLREWMPGRSPQDIARAFRQAAEGLEAAHAAGIVHRDFKPDNVLVDSSGRVMVTDFGLASRTLPSQSGIRSAATSRWGGTLPYMSPEQIDGLPLDARADVFAFGVSLWEALSGQRPYDGVDLESQRDALRTPPAWPRSAPRISRRLGRLLRSCIAVDRDARPTSLRPVIDALDPRASGGRWLGLATGACALAGLAAWALVEGPSPRALRCEAHDVAAMGESLDGDLGEGVQAPGTLWLEQMNRFRVDWQQRTLTWCEAEAEIDALADAQWSCLAHARTHFEVLRAHVLEAPEDLRPARLEDGLMRIAGLPSLRACEHPSIPPVPDDLALAERVRTDREALLRAELATRYGDAGRSAEILEGLQEGAAMGFPPFVAELRLVEATIAPENNRVALQHVVELALAVGHDRIAARGWLAMVQDLLERGDEGGRAEEYLAYADAAVRRLGTPDDLQSSQLLATAAFLLDAGRADEAADAYVAAARITPADGPDHEDALSGQANALSVIGRGEEALEIQRDLLARRVERYGETSLPVARSYLGLSRAHGDLEQVEASADAAAKATVVLEALLGPRHSFLIYSLHNEADARYRAGEVAQALTLQERARAIAHEKAGPQSAPFAKASHTYAMILGAAGRFDEALVVIDEATRIAYAVHGETHVETAGAELAHALLLRDAGEPEAARVHAERSLAIYEATSGPDAPATARAREGLGKILVILGERGEGAVQLERALSVLAAVDGGDAETQDLRAALTAAREP